MEGNKGKMEIKNPRRILAVSLAESVQHLSNFITDLTGTHPTPSQPSPSPPPSPPPSNQVQQQPSPSASSASAPHSPPPNDTAAAAAAALSSLAGTTHPLRLMTPYYTAIVPIWLDLIASSPSSSPSSSSSTAGTTAATTATAAAEWSASFLSPEAREVLDVLGAVVVVFEVPASSSLSSFPSSPSSAAAAAPSAAQAGLTDGAAGGAARERARELITHVGKVVREGLGGWEWDGVGLAVGIGGGGGGGGGGLGEEGDAGEELDEWEDLCAECGLEFVHVPARQAGGGKGKGPADDEDKRNQFGERTGIARVLEALQANDWSGAGMGGNEREGLGDDEEDDDDGEFDPESLDFGFDKEDFVGLRKAIWNGGEDGEGPRGEEEEEGLGDEDVQKLERMMLKLQAVRDATAGLPEEQRKRMAKRAVGEVMREL
ncbi:hypothetical protein VTK26DRAFT_5629 [Humicola hyalothermophila]